MQLETFFTVSQQTSQFLLSVVMGAVLGAAYDVFRAFRILFPFARKKAAVAAEDVIFMLLCGAAVFIFAVTFCRGQVRLFCILGALLGFVLYIFSVGSVVCALCRRAAAAVSELLQKVYSAVFAPAVKLIYPKKFKLFVHSYENEKK